MTNNETPRTAKVALRVYLATHDKTQTWLARKLRVSESHLSAILAGKRRTTPDLVAAVRDLTGVDLDQFPKTKAGRLVRGGELVAAGPA